MPPRNALRTGILVVAAGAAGAALALLGQDVVGGGTSPPCARSRASRRRPCSPRRSRTEGLSISEIYARTRRGVVQVNATRVLRGIGADPFFGLPFGEQRRLGFGSGFVLDKAGHVVTNLPRDRGRGRGQRQLHQPRPRARAGRRRRPGHRPGRPAGGHDLASAHAAAARRLRRGRGRRRGRRDRQPVRPPPHGHRRHRERAARAAAAPSGVGSTASSRPTRRSTAATPAGRSSTRTAA